jgi:hypothetical protein
LADFLVRDAILSTLAAADRIGVRILLVHALHQQAAGFYETLGFKRSPTDPLHLHLLLDLRLGKAKVRVTAKRTTLSNVKAVLSEGAASALNAYYATNLFSGGLKIGTATVSASSKIVKG